jgi:hypothetical protein
MSSTPTRSKVTVVMSLRPQTPVRYREAGLEVSCVMYEQSDDLSRLVAALVVEFCRKDIFIKI